MPGQCSRYRLDGLGFEPQRWEEMSSSPKNTERLRGTTHPPIQQVPGLFPGVGGLAKRSCHDVDLSPPSSAEVKNEWGYTSTLAIRIHGV